MGKNFSLILSAELEGIDAKIIEVETDVHTGLHNFTIVGLADKALSESKDRINSALKNVGVKPPAQENRRITVNLAPADVKKTGSQYDLPIAIGYLLATKQIQDKSPAIRRMMVGELALDGGIRRINGALSIAQTAAKNNISEIIIPKQNASEAAMIKSIKVIPVSSLQEVVDFIEGRTAISPQSPLSTALETNKPTINISDIRGNQAAKRALMIAAAGGHNLMMIGPPGTGKTMLAKALASILPPPSLKEVIEITRIYSAAGLLNNLPFISHRPFRAPHQTASIASVVGGGQSPRPGEISLAHRGVLFLDELPEFRRDLLESLRQPLESGQVTVTRVKNNIEFPARFTLVAAMNPCLCGYYQDQERECTCSMHQILNYQKKVSGPLLDRIDIQISVPRINLDQLRNKKINQTEDGQIKEKVLRAREKQIKRFSNSKIFTNSEMSSKLVEESVVLEPDAEVFLKSIFDKSLISARGYYRILKTAQTIADLSDYEKITKANIAEAFNYRLRESSNN